MKYIAFVRDMANLGGYGWRRYDETFSKNQAIHSNVFGHNLVQCLFTMLDHVQGKSTALS
jgi:hypothetical protein